MCQPTIGEQPLAEVTVVLKTFGAHREERVALCLACFRAVKANGNLAPDAAVQVL